MIDSSIFKAYDIRGVVGKNLNTDVARLIGRALAAAAKRQNLTSIALGRDGRLSGSELADALTDGLTAGGLDVLDVGMVPTPVLYFAAVTRAGGSGVMITGSHNPPEYNGFKMMLKGVALAGDTVRSLYDDIMRGLPENTAQRGQVMRENIIDDYIAAAVATVRLARPIRVALDAGNGVAGACVERLFQAAGCETTALFCDVDGHFPNHHPDPAKPENLRDLQSCLKNGDGEIGLAFDGDGDRLGVVCPDGEIIYPDRQLMLFADDILADNPNAAVIYDVKSTRLLADRIAQAGGKPVMSRTGHSFIKAAMREHNALLAGEMSGHLFFKDRWYGFDDGLYAGLRMVEILSRFDDAATPLKALPSSFTTPEINIPLPENENGHTLVAALADCPPLSGEVSRSLIDGLRVDFHNGFGLVRASNTTPVIVLRFEGDTTDDLHHAANAFRQLVEEKTPLSWPKGVLSI